MDKFGLPYWLDWKRSFHPSFEANESTDVAIVGAGITGLKLAYYLAWWREIVEPNGRYKCGTGSKIN